MGFGFTEEQEQFRGKVKDFVDRQLKPRVKESVEPDIFSKDLWRRVGAFGLLGLGLPEAYGGRPGDNIVRGIVAEELGRGDFLLAFALVPSYGTSLAILHGGSEMQREAWIPGLVGGDLLGSVGMTEPDCGSDLSLIRASAKKEGDHYVLNGEKSFVSWGLVADVHWIFVKTEKETKPRALTSFLIPLDLPGITKSPFSQMGLNKAGHCAIFLDDVRVPKDNRMGEEGGAFPLAAKVFPQTRMLLSLSALGLAQATFDEAVAFSKQRTAFGKHLGSFEGISFKMAEDATFLEATRWLCYRTLWLMDQGERCVKEIAMCKWWSTELALRIIRNTMLIHGHKGYSNEYPFGERLRDIIGYEIAESTPQILKLSICEEFLGKELRPFC